MALDSQASFSGIKTNAPSWRDDLDLAANADVWIFAYGSLMWNPGFAAAESEPAVLCGYHRRFCIVSRMYRGTPETPGLVLGLDCGGSCRGLAYRIAPDRVDETMDYLWNREMITRTYRPRLLPLRLSRSRRRVCACAFVADRAHEQYCGSLGDDATARRIVAAAGSRGSNLDYFTSTVGHLDALGYRDAGLTRLMEAVRREQEATASLSNPAVGTNIGTGWDR